MKKKIVASTIITTVLIILFCWKYFDVPNVIKSMHPKQGEFIKVGKMSSPRSNHETILLDDGNVLILGGGNKNAEIYNFKTKKFTIIGEMLSQTGHKNLTKLNNGKILITGGDRGYSQKATQIYNPETKEFESGPDMNYARAENTATLLKNGRVLIVGGDDVYNIDKRNIPNEIYNPKTNKFELTSKLKISRFAHSAILLKDGNVLIVGGTNKGNFLSQVEIYDVNKNIFKLAGNLKTARVKSNLYLLNNGNVLITGGIKNKNRWISSIFERNIEIYNPITQMSKIVAKRDSLAYTPTEVRLKNGNILLTGSCSGVGLSLICYRTSEIYNPKTNKFTKGKDMNYPRSDHKATLLKNGDVLITGSEGSGRTAELYIGN